MIEVLAELSTADPHRIDVQIPFRQKDWVKAVMGSRWDAERSVWTVPLSWTSCLALRAEATTYLTIGPNLRDWAKTVGATKKELLGLHPLMEGVDLPDCPAAPAMAELYPHQKVDALAISLAERYMLMNGTGTGKTRSALAGLRLIYDDPSRGDIFPALITAPLSMLRTWETEIKGFFPEATVSVATGTPKVVRDALEPGADFYICSWDLMWRNTRLAPYAPVVTLSDKEKLEKELNFLGLQTLVADEVHRCQTPKSKRTRGAWFLSEHARYVIGLTGTPVQDTAEDLYGLLHMLTPDEYPTKTGYMDRMIAFNWNEYGGKDVIGIHPSRTAEWLGNFDARTRRATKEMVLDFLPPKVESVRWVNLPTKHRKAYHTLETKYFAELSDGSVLTVDNQLTLATRLCQIANSMGHIEVVTDADGTPQLKENGEPKETFVMDSDESPKVDAFIEDLMEGDYEGESIVVFSDSRHLVEIVAAALRTAEIEFVAITGGVTGDDRQAAMDAFQKGEAKICLLTRAGGEGITLTAASTMVRLFRSWSLIVHTQVSDRIHRIGSEVHESIRYVDYIVTNTVEEGQVVRLADKAHRASETLRDGELLDLIKVGRIEKATKAKAAAKAKATT